MALGAWLLLFAAQTVSGTAVEVVRPFTDNASGSARSSAVVAELLGGVTDAAAGFVLVTGAAVEALGRPLDAAVAGAMELAVASELLRPSTDAAVGTIQTPPSGAGVTAGAETTLRASSADGRVVAPTSGFAGAPLRPGGDERGTELRPTTASGSSLKPSGDGAGRPLRPATRRGG